MSEYGHCHRGGQTGIWTNHHEMLELAEAVGSKFSDEWIPLPGVDQDQQVELIKQVQRMAEDPNYDNVVYWESETGEHGWCKKDTGQVVQWG